jgi:hypothetical protein
LVFGHPRQIYASGELIFILSSGGFMQNDSVKPPDDEETHWPKPEIDYTPKQYTRKEKILLGVKFVLFGVIFSILFWSLKYLMRYLYN